MIIFIWFYLSIITFYALIQAVIYQQRVAEYERMLRMMIERRELSFDREVEGIRGEITAIEAC